MGKYVDGFLLVVPNDKVDEYKKMAKMGAEAWMRHGALEYKECMGEDLVTKEQGGMKAKSFTDLAGAKSEETVWFSFIVFKSRKHRDEVNAKVMKEMSEMGDKDFQMPFDMKRFSYGGFDVVVEA